MSRDVACGGPSKTQGGLESRERFVIDEPGCQVVTTNGTGAGGVPRTQRAAIERGKRERLDSSTDHLDQLSSGWSSGSCFEYQIASLCRMVISAT